jgi:hypothetical protein
MAANLSLQDVCTNSQGSHINLFLELERKDNKLTFSPYGNLPGAHKASKTVSSIPTAAS